MLLHGCPVAKVTPAPPVAGAGERQRPLPRLTGRVVDNAHLLSPAQVASLTRRLAQAEVRTCHQVVIVTVPSLAGEPIEHFGQRVGDGWGIGRRGYDDGVLLVVAPAERKVRIEVGNGLRKALTDVEAARIIQNDILPRFRKGAMADGIDAGTTSILREIS
ncbi:TPM domain-containing protein [Sphingomonas sp.]|uniref:TPM domain-containing protein n=1 Tax=Sphingomonas sp. TaxID=28214 RepID=UPI0028AB8710|nr:TPM domain-containing protein [Sphingomonas sp.]